MWRSKLQAVAKDDALISAKIDAMLAEDTNDAPREQAPASAKVNLVEPVPAEIQPEIDKTAQP